MVFTYILIYFMMLIGTYPCRLDYLMANIKGNKFERTKTLADGDDCCNCNMMGLGYTEWSPEKGFEQRK